MEFNLPHAEPVEGISVYTQVNICVYVYEHYLPSLFEVTTALVPSLQLISSWISHGGCG